MFEETENGNTGVGPPGANVPGYLLPVSIASTLLCCAPAGIAAIVFSVQAKSRSDAGDTATASQKVKNANISLMVAAGLGVLVWIFNFFFFILGVFGSGGGY